MEQKITALRVQKRNQNRVNVYLDGTFAFGLAREVAAWLQVGQVIDSEKIDQLRKHDEQEIAYQHALRLLSYRSRSRAEIRYRLEKHGCTDTNIEVALARLERSGLINDKLFAQNWIENRSEYRPRSRRALSFELAQRGIDPQEVVQALQGVEDHQLALLAAKKQAHKLSKLEWPDFRRRMLAHLARLGFNYQSSATAVNSAWDELHPQEPSLQEEVDHG